MCQILWESPEFYRRYYEKHFGLFFCTQCIWILLAISVGTYHCGWLELSHFLKCNSLHSIFATLAVPSFGHVLYLTTLVLLIFNFFMCRKLVLFLGKTPKLLQPELFFLAKICTKSFVAWPRSTTGAYNTRRLPSWFRGGTPWEGKVGLWGGEMEKRGKKRGCRSGAVPPF